jgi:2-dehydro-3-deoxygluconokinase
MILNFPDIQKQADKDLVAFGELMMRLNCPHGKRFSDTGLFEVLFGGAEANVGVLLAGLGMRSRLVSVLPANELGRAARSRLRFYGVPDSDIWEQEGRMGLYFTENGHMLRPSVVLYDRKDSAFSKLRPGMLDWEGLLAGAGWFHWSGITPGLSSDAAAVCLEALESARRLGLTVSSDMNYRSRLWSYGKSPASIMPELLGFSDLVVGDLHAAEAYWDLRFDHARSEEDQFHNFVQILQERTFPAACIASGFREREGSAGATYRGAVWINRQYYYSPVFSIPQVVDRIGSGDAFSAGLIYGLRKGFPPQELVDFATGCAVLKHGICGDFVTLREEEIRLFLQDGPGTRVLR